MNDQRSNITYVLITALAVILTWLIHEFAHWATGEALGYDSIMRLNSVSTGATDDHVTRLHSNMVTMSGPLITILQALVVYLILSKKGWNRLLFPFLFVPFYMRLLAGVMNFIQPNDEGRLSADLGVGLFTLSIMVSSLLFYWVYTIGKKYSLRSRFILWTLFITLLVSSLLIMCDLYFRIRLL